MSKSFTATAFLILASKGLVGLDDPIRKYYPEFTVNTKFHTRDAEIEKITFRRMLSHWASFSHEALVGNNFDNAPCSFEEHIQSIAHSWLRSPVGSEAAYSNLGYDLTGYVMGKILDKSYEEVMREELLQPLGITTATFNINEALKHPFAKGHIGEFETPTVQVPMLPAGGLYISAIDIAKYISFHLRKGKINDQQIIDSKLWTEMYQPQFLDSKEFGYGLGVYSVKKQKGSIIYGHGGGGYGYLTDAMWIPDYNVGVVVLANDMKQGGKQTALTEKVLELMVNEKEKPKVKKVEPELLRRLEGTYYAIRTLFQRITYEGDKLYSYAVNGTRLELIPQSPTEFATIDGGKYLFELNEEGFPLSFYREPPRALWPYRAKYNDGPNDKPGPNKTEWQDYLGIYQFQVYGGTGHLALSIKNGYLYLTSGDE
ncbi:MAG: serine hydrolase domain-containing protein, partial [Promethearchaeota archaeon]